MPQLFPLAVCMAVSALFSFAQSPLAVKAAPLVGVFLDFDSVPGAPSLAVMKKEVENLLERSGLSIAWRTTSENHGDSPFAMVVVLKFKGMCKAGWTPPQHAEFGSLGSEPHTLASTRVQDGHVMPYGEVECDQVRKALSYLRPGTGQGERQSAMGRAMGRVVAHELYHMLASTTRHTLRGLAKATQSLEDLISPEKLGFDAEESKAIGAGQAFNPPHAVN